MTVQCERQRLRNLMRQRRRALSGSAQQRAANQLVQRLLNYRPLQQANTVAVFISREGEIDTTPLINALWHQNKQVYLPLLHPFCPGYLLFQHYTPRTQLTADRLNILTPTLDVRTVIPLEQLEMMMVPLVAFDNQGQRLGMGGGYYDRTLAQRSTKTIQVIGLAHRCQHLRHLPAADWDIPLPTIITPDQIWCWPKNSSTPHSRLHG